MMETVDLTPRQSARLLQQAVRTRARLEVEPQAGSADSAQPIGAVLIRADARLLCVEFEDGCRVTPLELMGAFCEVRTTLSDHMYYFSTCVLDLPDGEPATRVLMSAPETMQAVNRRRFERTSLSVAAQVRVYPADAAGPYAGLIDSISAGGLSCVLPGVGPDSALFVGDVVRVQFEIPGVTELFELATVLCTKLIHPQGEQVKLGLEFVHASGDGPQAAALERFRIALLEASASSQQPEGDE